jgi:carboxypeptidase PM20D1
VATGQAAARLGEAIGFRTISTLERERFDPQPCLALHAFRQREYPGARRVLQREVVGGCSLLYTWAGTEPARPSLLLLGHLDVVPVEPGTEARWTHPLFSGRVADGYVWGRGAMDDKVSVLAALEAVELLVAQGFRPHRTVHLAFGHDGGAGREGRGGADRGAAALPRGEARALAERGARDLAWSDPGAAAPRSHGRHSPEKGWLNLELSVTAAGGHASMPPPSMAVGILGAAVHRLDANPMPAAVRGPARALLTCPAPEMPLLQRVVMSNLWLFEPPVRAQRARSPTTNAGIRTAAGATMVWGGSKENVLLVEARAAVNFRILPGNDAPRVIEHARRAVADPRVRIRALGGQKPSGVAPTDSPVCRALAAAVRQVYPDVLVAPALMIAATDSQPYRSFTPALYRFLPLRLAPEDLVRFHGTGERIAVDNYADIVRFYVRLLEEAAQ